MQNKQTTESYLKRINKRAETSSPQINIVSLPTDSPKFKRRPTNKMKNSDCSSKMNRIEALSTQVESFSSSQPFLGLKERIFKTQTIKESPMASDNYILQKETQNSPKIEKNHSIRASNKSSYDYMNPQKNFFFLDYAQKDTKRNLSREDFRENTTLFELEQLDIRAKKGNSDKWKRLDETKPINNYTIYDGLK